MKALKEYIPETKWHAWKALPKREKMLLISAYLIDHYKPREKSKNRGVIVDAAVRECGYDPADRYAWCAIWQTACAILAGYKPGQIPSSAQYAAVRYWVSWAKTHRYAVSVPQRGDLCYWLNSNGTGHIGQVVRVLPLGFLMTLEGNTSSGEEGSQREGDGAYRRIRRRSTWHGFIRLPE
jgi:hypothetical protein